MTALIIQASTAGLFLTVIIAAVYWARQSDDRIRKRRWKHVALAFAGLMVTVVPWLVLVGQDFQFVEWRWLFVSAGPWLTLFGVLLFVQGTLFDLSRDRICRRCGFDLRMREGLTCNECGRVAKSEAHLRAIRPSRTLQVAAVLVCIAAFIAWRGVEVRDSGWRGAIPDSVLFALWPWLPDDVITADGSSDVGGTLAWRLRTMRSTEKAEDLVAQIHRRLERATTMDEIVRLLYLRDAAKYRTRALPLSAATIERIVAALETAEDHAVDDLSTVAGWLAQNLLHGDIGKEAIDALLARKSRLVAIANEAGRTPTVRSRAAGLLLLMLVDGPGQMPVDSFVDLMLTPEWSARQQLRQVLALDTDLYAAIFERAEADEDRNAPELLANLLFYGGQFAAAPELHRRTVEAALARLSTDQNEQLHYAPLFHVLARKEDLPPDLDAAVTLRLVIEGRMASAGILRLFERGPVPETTGAIERFRAELQLAVETGMPTEWALPREMRSDPDAVREHQSLSAAWETQRDRATQSAMLLAWEAVHSGGRHDGSAALLQKEASRLRNGSATTTHPVTAIEHSNQVWHHLRSMGVIDERSPEDSGE